MEAVQGTNKILSTQPITGSGTAVPAAQASGGEFDATLKALISPSTGNKVSEEALFSALVQERVKKLKGEDALTKFNTLLAGAKERMTKAGGFVPLEDATKEALREARASGVIDAKEADSIYSQSFAAAQLDENKEALFDDRGGPNDPTMAVASMEQALLLSKGMIEGIDAGTKTAAIRSLDEASNPKMLTAGSGVGHTSESGAGFLFKPVSDSDGKLAVLLPPQYAGLISSVDIFNSNGDKVETGRYTGNGNGGRDHFRFSKPGGQYSDNLNVVVTLATGEVLRYLIQETSQRTENISPNGSSTNQGSDNTQKNNTSPKLGDNSSL
ncbi:MAG: hypothetical protein ACK5Y6_04650 [Pseudomonadota bacterium]